MASFTKKSTANEAINMAFTYHVTCPQDRRFVVQYKRRKHTCAAQLEVDCSFRHPFKSNSFVHVVDEGSTPSTCSTFGGDMKLGKDMLWHGNYVHRISQPSIRLSVMSSGQHCSMIYTKTTIQRRQSGDLVRLKISKSSAILSSGSFYLSLISQQ